jgi:heme exporter protein C
MGVIDIPIIHYSVYWWNTLHQQASILKFAPPSIAHSMLFPILAMFLAFLLYYVALVLMYARSEIIRREQKTSWVKEVQRNIAAKSKILHFAQDDS